MNEHDWDELKERRKVNEKEDSWWEFYNDSHVGKLEFIFK
ncbi:hypothetical protein RV09_GL001095 [Enterococcus moraviensis]|nr:hypothetical protein RV09_GL001095 [Enterococcus moraviensis]